MQHLLLVAIGGALGALLRYGASVWITRLWGHPLPLATWTVNLVGCFLIGFLVPMLGKAGMGETMRYLLVIGFLGSLTTFSTFSLETVALWEAGHGGLALLNALGSVALGVLCVWSGLQVARLLGA